MKSDLICADCGTRTAQPGTSLRGNPLIELVSWCAMLVPGLIYSIWRRSASTSAGRCPSCARESLIPTTAPIGRRLLSQYHGTEAVPLTVKVAEHGVSRSLGRLVGRHPLIASGLSIIALLVLLRGCA